MLQPICRFPPHSAGLGARARFVAPRVTFRNARCDSRASARALLNSKEVNEIDRAVKTTVFLKNAGDFQAMNEFCAKFFRTVPPARTTVQAVLPNDAALVEIDVVAIPVTRSDRPAPARWTARCAEATVRLS